MEAKAQFLCAIVVFIGLIGQGWCQCALSDIKINQDTTGRMVGGKQEWSVTIFNQCKCSQEVLRINCNGFQSTEKPDPRVITVAGSICLITDQDQPIRPFSSVSFTYAWDHSFNFTPEFSQLSCT